MIKGYSESVVTVRFDQIVNIAMTDAQDLQKIPHISQKIS